MKNNWLIVVCVIVIIQVLLFFGWTSYNSSNKIEQKVLKDRYLLNEFTNLQANTIFISFDTEHKNGVHNIVEIESNNTNLRGEENLFKSGFSALNIDETFASVKYENQVDCSEAVNLEQNFTNHKLFGVISGFSISSGLLIPDYSDVHFILVGQENDIKDTNLLKQTAEETLNSSNSSGYHLVFCSDHIDNNFNGTIQNISALFKTKIEAKGLKAVIFLGIETQHTLWPEINNLLPGNHISRKNLGYLMGIALGAEFIMDLDGSHTFTHSNWLSIESLLAFRSNWKHPVIASLHSDVTNPYVLMGPRTKSDENLDSATAMKMIWPRGYPTSELAHKETPTFHSLEEIETRLTKRPSTEDCFRFSNDIIQSLADERPDVDSLYEDSNPLPVTFLPQSPRLSIHPSQFAPFNAHATIFSRRAFWALLLPASVGEGVSDIWRGYIAQTFMHCTGSLLAFSTPIVKRVYNKDGNMLYQKYQDEAKRSSQTKDLLGLLSNFDCVQSSSNISELGISNSLPHCLAVLYSKLFYLGFLGSEKDISLMYEWIKALKYLGYLFPNFFPNKECLSKRDSLYRPSWDFADHPFCTESLDSPRVPPGRGKCGDSLLTVVHINFGHKEIIPIWLAQWQYVYPNPIFYISTQNRKSGSCMLEPTEYFNVACNKKDSNGQLSYESMINALARYPHYDNYLFIHDDAYISHKTMEAVIEDGVSMISECEFMNGGRSNWMWIPLIENSMQALWVDGNFQPNSFYRKTTEKNCPELYANESKIAKDQFIFHYTMSDVFILTKKDIDTFLVIMKKYLEVNMFLEAAIPMTLRCALNAREIKYLSFWDGRRGDIKVNKKEICNPNSPKILHPLWKISRGDKSEKEWLDELEQLISIRYCDYSN